MFTVPKSDFEVRTFRVSGAGGQRRDKVETGVEIRHPASGAKGRCTDSRSQATNKTQAFKRLVEPKLFQSWIAAKSRGLKTEKEIEKEVDESLSDPKNIKIEIRDGKKWREVTEKELI